MGLVLANVILPSHCRVACMYLAAAHCPGSLMGTLCTGTYVPDAAAANGARSFVKWHSLGLMAAVLGSLKEAAAAGECGYRRCPEGISKQAVIWLDVVFYICSLVPQWLRSVYSILPCLFQGVCADGMHV